MSGSSLSYKVGRVQSGEADWISVPLGARRARPIILCHGATGFASTWLSAGALGSVGIAAALCQAGFVVIAGDFGGDVYGNDTAIARLEAARVLAAQYVDDNSKALFVGFSMGGHNSLNYCRANPTKVAAIAALSPTASITDAYDRNVLGLQSAIGTAWGVTYPTPLPSRADASSSANAALIASSGAPVKIWYYAGDTAVPESTQLALATAIGSNASVVKTSDTQDHGDALLPLIDKTQLISFLTANAG